MAGDFNVDFLPTMAIDPFGDFPGRVSRHEERRMFLEALLEGLKLQLQLPEESAGFPPVQWATECLSCPITQVPMGSQHGLPSLLDYGAATTGLITKIRAFWTPLPRDHAATLHVTSRADSITHL